MITKNMTLGTRCKGTRGITLTELLMATIMIGIVMLGVASFSGSINRLQGSTSRSTIVAMRTKAVMAKIVKDASSAVGDNQDCGTEDSGYVNWDINCGSGIRTDQGGGGKLGICFRHDVAASPEDYTDDDWICYYKGAGADKKLFYCGITNPNDVPVTNAGKCNLNIEILKLWPGNDNYFNIVRNAAGQLRYVELTISNIYNRNLGAGDPMVNPTYSITTRVSPPGQSQ